MLRRAAKTGFVAFMALAYRASASKVFAHFMAANSYSYSQSDWANDINTASGIGIDGFALNLNGNDYEIDRLADAYAAAISHGSFQFFYSFDMSYSWDAGTIATIVEKYATSSATYTWNGKVLVSTYSGESYGDSFWNSVKSTLSSAGVSVSFAPAFTSYRDPSLASQLLSDFSSVDGFFNWWSWPADNGNLLTTDTDLAYQSAIKDNRSGPYIMSVSPLQFKELGEPNDWVELSDTLWKYRWEQAIEDVKPDIVEIVTWNDYAESHYIGDINPNVYIGDAAAYVDGFPHADWRIIGQYYISWFKSGSAPSVTTDQLIFWYREYPKAAVCPTGDLPRNSQYPADAVFAFALLASPATVTLDIGSTHYQWDAPAGASIGSVNFPAEDNQIPFFQIERNGSVEKSGYGSLYVTKECNGIYNFNFWVGAI
ncbi:glycoside hydrolase family 71 protein [Clavulina sp. PMI_390]|nr:glycoside hydrolase family 71 protein [Clavulina sp. PMI_390]